MSYRKLNLHPLHSSLRRALTRAAAGALGAAAPLAALANPSGGQVAAGSATINSPSSNGVVINQSSQRAVINWQQFSVGANEYVQFVQPNSSAVALNRVVGGNPSSILGRITANGQVFLVNPNGVYFAPGASVDVQGMVASTLDLNDSDFMQGHYAFSKAAGAPDAGVVNQGSIHAGYGGYVVLAGDYAHNDGMIDVQAGRVYLAAGGSALLSMDNSGLVSYVVNGKTLSSLAGVDNTGEITANGGAVVMTADVANALTATAVNNSGLITAHSAISRGGEIVLLAQGGDIENSGTLDASGGVAGAQGGTVIIRGDGHTQLDPTSVIDTSGTAAKGGFIELSGHTLHIGGEVTAGRHGDLLLDPSVIHIVAGAGHTSPSVGTGSIGTGFIAGALNAGSNVAIVASNSIGNTTGTAINATGVGNLTIAIGTVGGASCGIGGICVGTGTPGISVGSGGTINLTGLAIHIAGDFHASAGHSGGNVTVANVAAKSISINAANITTGNLHATGPAASGDVLLVGSRNSSAFSSGTVTVSGSITADNGKVVIHALGGGDSGGGNISVSGTITAAKSVDIQANYLGGSNSGGGQIHLQDVTGKSVSVNAVGSHPSISAGNVTAAAGSINLHGSGTGSGSGNIKTGNLNANGAGKAANVSLFLSNRSASIQVGTVNAADINVSLNGNGNIVTGALTAVSAAGPAHVFVSAFAQSGSNAVRVNGPITAAGKLNGASFFSSAMPGFGAPIAAGVTLQAAGSDDRVAHDVKVSGNVSVTATAGHFAFSHSNETGVVRHFIGSGNGGMGAFELMADGSQGSANVSGNITVTGTDALVSVRGADIVVHNVTATGKGHDIHHKAVGSVPTNVIYSSHNTAGAAVVDIGGWNTGSGSSGGATTTLSAGTIAVSGKGVGQANLFASNVTAGNVTAAAAAAIGTVTTTATFSGSSHFGSGLFFRSLGDARLMTGHQTAGLADVVVARNRNFGGRPPSAARVNLGAVSVSGVGEAHVVISGKQVSTKSLGATATKGIEVGSGSFHNGGSFSGSNISQTFGINGGKAGVDIFSGSSSSRGPVNVAGNIAVKGPVGGVRLEGNTIKVSGSISVVGSGGTTSVDTQVVSYGGAHLYHTKFTGPGDVTGVNMGGLVSTASVNVAGTVTVKGQGLVGVNITGGKVALGGLSASASAARNYSILDTRVSSTPDNFTAGSVAILVFDGNSAGITGPAAIGGDLTLKAAGNAYLPGQLTVGGKVTVAAAGNITTDVGGVAPRFDEIGNAIGNSGSSSSGIPSSGIGPLTLKAGAVSMVAGGSIDLTGATATVSGVMQLVADKDIILSGVNLNVGTFIADASGTIHNGGAAGIITAKGGLGIVAGKDINLSSTQINVGAGNVSSIAGDAQLLQALAFAGLSPNTSAPNATFIAGGSLTLGGLKLTGSYLYLQAATISILGPVSVPSGAVVQISPIDPSKTMGVEQTGTNGAGFSVTNADLLSLFPHTTLVLGNADETGDVSLGQKGIFDIGDSNLIIYSTGTITGLANVTTTGLITSLEALLGPPVPPPTSGEIDPNSSNNNNVADRKRQQQGEDIGTDGDQKGGTIGEDSNPSSVCH